MGSRCWSAKGLPRFGSGPVWNLRSRRCDRRPASEIEMEERPGYLRPVPSASEATARELEPEQEGTPGLIPPSGTGSSAMFLTDVIAGLGYVSREQVDQV